jgi:cell wall-associated NlpC family hydrolase
LIFFGKNGKVSHVAMVVSNTYEGISVVHSTTSKGVMVQNITKSTYWKPKILFARDVISP